MLTPILQTSIKLNSYKFEKWNLFFDLQLQLIFETLECILIRLVDDLSKYQSVGHTIVKKIWGSHTGSLYSSLSQRNKASQIKTTLKLLSAMTMLGETSARAILTQIDFSNPNIQLLYGRRDRKVSFNYVGSIMVYLT